MRTVVIEQEMCENEVTDLVFLIDESGSVGLDNFLMMTQFVSQVIGNLNLGSDSARVAIRTFSTDSKRHYSLKNYNLDLERLVTKVSKDIINLDNLSFKIKIFNIIGVFT